MNQETTKIEEVTDNLKNYVKTNIELLKLEGAERAAVIGSGLISSVVLGFTGILGVVFISIAVGFYISDQFGNHCTGFAIVAGFYFLLTLIFVLGRKKMLERPFSNAIINVIFNKK